MTDNTLHVASSNQGQGPVLPAPISGHPDTAAVLSHNMPMTLPTQQHTGPASSGLTADDLDLIEKVWVQKAKAIVQATINDPREQSRLLGDMKLEYIQKRFGKDIGTGK